MTQDTIFTLSGMGSTKTSEKGSRFYTFCFPVWSQEEIDRHLAEIKSRYADATHHCYAWRLDPSSAKEFAQDDGEPSGTAGLPILHTLASEQLFYSLIIVVRYFGGTKLGKPGLIQAYRHAAESVLADIEKKVICKTKTFHIQYPYTQENRIRELKKTYRLMTHNESFMDVVTITVFCRTDDAIKLEHTLNHLKHVDITFTADSSGYQIFDPGQN
ncbi:YigZ family protein [Balneolaceae bacterium ANBcel3]|nr:YigZ family protein [Balneolaceae bacterium ANBcel3]